MAVPVPHGPASDAFLASLVNSSNDAILTKDLSGIITYWNRGAERIFGYTAEEAIGQPVTLLFPPDRVNEEPMILERIRRGEMINHYETVRRRKDGSAVDISLTVSPILDSNGKVVGASKVARDVSVYRREQERWRVTLSSIGDAVISTDARGLVAFLNPVAEQLTGWKLADARNQHLDTVFHIVNEGTRKAVESPVAKVLRDGGIVGLANHTLLIAKDGTERPIDDSAAPILDAFGAILGVVLVFRDVSERRSAELAALRLAAIVEGSDDAIIGKDLNGTVTSWNPGAQRIFGYTEAEMIGKPIFILLPPDRYEEEQNILNRLQRGERVEHFDTLRVRKDGQCIHVSITVSPIRDGEGHIVGASKIARDVTALRTAQEQLRAHAAQLEEKVRERTAKLEETIAELEAFSYSLSHDMRAPLRAIQSFSEIILQDFGEKIPDAVVYLQKVISAANRLDRLVQDVLSFARLSRAEVRVVSLDLDRLVREILQERPELQEPKARVVVEGALLPVSGDEASLTQCLTNLLSNAVKFVPRGVKPTVNLSTERVGERVRISVRDNGIGIREKDKTRLFAIFQRLEAAREYEGTGVGLAIVRKAAERMRGGVGVESEEGKGSTFWIELPKG